MMIGAVSASDNETNNTLRDEINSFAKLSDEINSINEVIKLEKDYKYIKSDNMTKGIVINKSITIDGKGHTIDADNKCQIFKIKGAFKK